jgi:TRAP-type C4-dicarboxylate transport system substrate-binding protein
MKKIVYFLAMLLVLTLTMVQASVWAADMPLKFKAVTFSPVKDSIVAGFRIFADKVNEKFKDYINIQPIGGPEVIPPFQLHEAVRSGVIDMCLTSCAYYPSLLWVAQTVMFTNKDFREIAKTNYFEIMHELHKQVGLIWLGSCTQSMTFHLFTNIRASSPYDFAGKRIRVFPAFIPLTKALGATPVTLPMGDIYTAMQRGTVDGFFMTHFGFVTDFSWHEVTKYVVDYDLYEASAVILVNPEKWQKLPVDIQKAIIKYKKEVVDPAIAEYYKREGLKEWNLMLEKGVKPITFSPKDAELFLKLAYDSAWDYIISKEPELGLKLKQMLVK